MTKNKWPLSSLLEVLQKKGIAFEILREDKESLEVVINVLARPSSKREQVEVLKSGEIKIHLKSRPIDGEANRDLAQFLGRGLSLAPSNILLLKGAKSKVKKICLRFVFSPHKDISYYREKLAEFFPIASESE